MDISVGMDKQELPQHALRLEMAKAEASYELGNPEWGERIVAVYTGKMDPSDEAIEAWEN